MGRPLLGRSELRQPVEIYLSATERDQVSRQAAAAGLPLSGFIRRAALRQQVHSVPVPNVQKWEELARLAANLNQLAAAANRGMVAGADAAEFEQLRQLVQQLRLALIGGSGS